MNEFEWLALITVTLEHIEWGWHKSLQVNGKTYEITNLDKNVNKNAYQHCVTPV